MLNIIARKFPGNEIRLSWYVAKRPEVERYEDNPTEGNHPPVNPVPVPVPAIVTDESPSPLTSCSISRLKPPEGIPSVGKNTYVPFTRRKARNIKHRLTAMDSLAKPGEVLLLTGTLPGSTVDAMRTIAELASAIVKKLHRWVRYHSDSKYWLYVWEFQKRGALHIHFAVWEPDPDKRTALTANWKSKWTGILQSFGVEKTLCLFDRGDGRSWLEDVSVVQADAVELDKSVAHYLSKYLAKSKYAKDEDAELFCPQQWSRCSKDLLSLTESLTTTVKTTPLTTGTTMKLMEEVKYELESEEGVTLHYTHRGEYFGTTVHYSRSEGESDESWIRVLAVLSRYTDGFWSHTREEPMEDDPAVAAYKERNRLKAADLAGRDNIRSVDYWRDKYGYLGLRFDSSEGCFNDKDNANAITTGNDNENGIGNAGTEGADQGNSEDCGATQLCLL